MKMVRKGTIDEIRSSIKKTEQEKLLNQIMNTPIKNYSDVYEDYDRSRQNMDSGRILELGSQLQTDIERSHYGPGIDRDALHSRIIYEAESLGDEHTYVDPDRYGKCVAVQPIAFSRYFDEEVSATAHYRWDMDTYDDVSYSPSVIEYDNRFLEFRIGESTVLNAIDADTGKSQNIIDVGECPSVLAYSISDMQCDYDEEDMEDYPDFDIDDFDEDERYVNDVSRIEYKLDCYIPQERNMYNALNIAHERLKDIGIDIDRMTKDNSKVYIDCREIKFADKAQSMDLGWLQLPEEEYGRQPSIARLLNAPRTYSTFSDNLARDRKIHSKDMKWVRDYMVERKEDTKVLASKERAVNRNAENAKQSSRSGSRSQAREDFGMDI